MSFDISLLNLDLQLLSESIWTVNTMKRIQYFPDYVSNTYLVDSRNLMNEDLLNNLANSDIFGCFLDMRNVQGNLEFHQLVVAGSQGIVIFYSFEKASNNVMKAFFKQISKTACYGKNFAVYRKILQQTYSIHLDCKDIEANDQYKNYTKFLSSHQQISSVIDNYHKENFSQSANTNTVLCCIANAFEAVSIYYFFSVLANRPSSPEVPLFAPSMPPGIMSVSANQFPPGMMIPSFQQNPQIMQEKHMIQEQNVSSETKPHAPIMPNMLKTNNQKTSEINKEFWKNLENLIAILSSTEKIEISNGHFICKTCNKTFDTYVYLLEHCWLEHQSALKYGD